MTNIEKILEFLSQNNEGYCDDCLSRESGIGPRQQVNSVCRSLAMKGKILRPKALCCSCLKNKKVNKLNLGSSYLVEPKNKISTEREKNAFAKPWFWEGNIQVKLTNWLKREGYKIISFSDTATRSQGIDVIAQDPRGRNIWISVKGYPETGRHAQARHYFAEAIFDLIFWGDRSQEVDFGIALPAGFTTYKNLLMKVEWFRKKLLPFKIYWVDKGGRVLEG
ncbi:MAG: hypothetical protein PHU81_02245 [Acidobacteriota bacterium]|nr:hypothetical protein [Acidobacteriota bacterium]